MWSEKPDQATSNIEPRSPAYGAMVQVNAGQALQEPPAGPELVVRLERSEMEEPERWDGLS